MTRGDKMAAGVYLLTAATTLPLAEWLRGRGVPAPLTRKLVHVVAGLSPLYVTHVAETKRVGVGVYVLTTLANALFWKRGIFRAMSSHEGSPGIVYFALVQTMLLAWLWTPGSASTKNRIALAALLTLALGDAAAALVGQRWGRHHYSSFGNQKSWEGSAAMLVVTTLAVGATLGTAHLPQWQKAALAASLTATTAEAISPRGLDNLTAPLSIALMLLALIND